MYCFCLPTGRQWRHMKMLYRLKQCILITQRKDMLGLQRSVCESIASQRCHPRLLTRLQFLACENSSPILDSEIIPAKLDQITH